MKGRKVKDKFKSYPQLPSLPSPTHDYFEVESRFVDIKPSAAAKPLRLHYKIAGAGAPLVLLHGLMTDGYSFRYVISKLARHYQVIVPDLPGAGQSEAPQDLPMDPIAVADVLSKFISALGLGKVYLVGNSLGGYEALWFEILHPEQVQRLVVMHSPGFPDLKTRALKLVSRLPGSHGIYSWLVKHIPREFVAKNVHYFNGSLLSKEEVDHYAKIFQNEAQKEMFWKILRESMDSKFMGRLVRELKKRGPQISERTPIRLFWATKDPLVPVKNGPRYLRLLPKAKLVHFENSYHFLQVDSPEKTIEEIIRFGRD